MSDIWFVELYAVGSEAAIASLKERLPRSPSRSSFVGDPEPITEPNKRYRYAQTWHTTFGASIGKEDVEDWIRGKSKHFQNPTTDLSSIPDLVNFVELYRGDKNADGEPEMILQLRTENGEIDYA